MVLIGSTVRMLAISTAIQTWKSAHIWPAIIAPRMPPGPVASPSSAPFRLIECEQACFTGNHARVLSLLSFNSIMEIQVGVEIYSGQPVLLRLHLEQRHLRRQ